MIHFKTCQWPETIEGRKGERLFLIWKVMRISLIEETKFEVSLKLGRICRDLLAGHYSIGDEVEGAKEQKRKKKIQNISCGWKYK